MSKFVLGGLFRGLGKGQGHSDNQSTEEEEEIVRLKAEVKSLKEQVNRLGSALARTVSKLRDKDELIRIQSDRIDELTQQLECKESTPVKFPSVPPSQTELLSMLENDEMIEELASKHGWDATKERDDQGNPLFLVQLKSCAEGNQDPLGFLFARYLYTHRSDVKADEIRYGDTAIHLCAWRARLYPMLIWLLKEGSIDPNLGDNFGNTPLHQSYHSTTNMAALLNDPRVDINRADEYGTTPLMLAIGSGEHYQSVRLLLEHGCDTTMKRYDGKTALDMARTQLKSIQSMSVGICKSSRIANMEKGLSDIIADLEKYPH